MCPKVHNATIEGGDGANGGVENSPMPNGFPTYCILLCGVREGGKIRCAQMCQRSTACIQATRALVKGDVLEAKGSTVILR